jgi:WD40 repeat protein
VRVWDTATRHPPVLLPLGLKEEICLVAFTPDGAALTAVSADGQVVRWDRTAGRQAYAVRLPGTVYGAALAADGRHLATANANNTVYILRLAPPTGAGP